MALHLLGLPLDHPVMAGGLAGLDGFVVREAREDGVVRRLEACQSPVWDTALAVSALLDAGVPALDEAVVRGSDWLLGMQIRVRGDWSVRRPRLTPGGWAFEFANDNYPDTDDTAEVVLALRRCVPREGAERSGAVRAAVDAGVGWTAGMQSRDGGWGAFDADNTAKLPAKLPFCDFGAVTDPPSADVTAHIVEMLAAEGLADLPQARRGVAWLLARQEPDGSWFGRWGANHVYGTGAVVPALIATGMARTARPVRRAVDWLLAHQNADGGWGEDLRSYRDPAWVGRGDSTPSQTAWALLALLAVQDPDGPAVAPNASTEATQATAVERGVGYLLAQQSDDGGWPEDLYTGTGFPGDFYLNYHLYRVVFPISALGRYLAGRS
jgi:squalene-hopene/tetraprenyl-beta-curcumene cyclase